jgi:hypothetical protein
VPQVFRGGIESERAKAKSGHALAQGWGNKHVTARITHLREAAAHHTRYSDHKCKCVASSRTPLRPF